MKLCACLSTTILFLSLCTLPGCGGGLSGDWTGTVVPNKTGSSVIGKGYSETKPSLKCTLGLGGNGHYEAKMQEVSSGGSWHVDGSKLTLTPATYMGMTREQLSSGKEKGIGLEGIFAPYVLTVSADQKTLVHADEQGVTTYTR